MYALIFEHLCSSYSLEMLQIPHCFLESYRKMPIMFVSYMMNQLANLKSLFSCFN